MNCLPTAPGLSEAGSFTSCSRCASGLSRCGASRAKRPLGARQSPRSGSSSRDPKRPHGYLSRPPFLYSLKLTYLKFKPLAQILDIFRNSFCALATFVSAIVSLAPRSWNFLSISTPSCTTISFIFALIALEFWWFWELSAASFVCRSPIYLSCTDSWP